MIKEKEIKIGLFIDYANLWSSYKRIWKKLDFKELIKYIEIEFDGKLLFKSVYFAYPKESTRNYDIEQLPDKLFIWKLQYRIERDKKTKSPNI